jgi:glycosyltransferase involved in cell wall biosynthesis
MPPAPGTILVVPCYNEERRLPRAVFRAFAEKWTEGRLLFVDDGSVDGTRSVLDGLCAATPGRVEVLGLGHNQGKAEAVRRGMLRAFEGQPRFVGFWDADLATPLETLPLFQEVFRERPDIEIVLGARVRLLGHDVRRNPTRHYLGRVFATLVSLTLGLELYDSQCGAKLFRPTPDVQALFARPFRSRWIFDVELLARFAAVKRARGERDVEPFLYELPLPVWHDVAGSKVRPRDFVRAVLDLAGIYQERRRAG